MFSLMTLQNSMDERKLKKLSGISSQSTLFYECVYMCVCVCAGPALCV